MSDSEFHRSAPQVNRKLFVACGVAGIAGSLISVITDFIGIAVVNGYNPISQTISDLAMGPHAWIQDFGLNLYAFGLIACAIALWRWDLGDWRWRLGAAFLAVISVVILIISEYDQYANLPNSSGMSIHLYSVYALGILFPTVCVLLGFGLRRLGRKWRWFSWVTAVVWVIFAPAFFRVPTAIDGLYERFVSLILLAWSMVIAWLIFQKGKESH